MKLVEILIEYQVCIHELCIKQKSCYISVIVYMYMCGLKTLLTEPFHWTFPFTDIVNNTLTAQLHNMLHYDVMSWWQLKIQVSF